MEWALHAADASSLKYCDDLFSCASQNPESSLARVHDSAAELVRRIAGPICPRRVYVGNEFCEHLIPTLSSFSKLCCQVQQRGLAITLLTPPVTGIGLKKLWPIFKWLAARDSSAEVVFNDWGTLQILHEEFSTLRPVRGRLLTKTMRDPRVTPLYGARDAPEAIRASMQPDSLEIRSLQDLLHRYDVRTVELDIPLQRFAPDLSSLPFEVAFYFPYGFVTTGRQCMIGSLHREQSARFRPGRRCQRECQSYFTEHRFNGTALSTKGTAFYQSGNTFFYSPRSDVLESFLQQAEARGVARVIYEPDLPM